MINTHRSKIRNIAVCFSGECRTYNKCAQSINRFFNLPGVNVKYFGHAWNTNTYKIKHDNKTEVVVEEHSVDFINTDIRKFYNFEHLEVQEKFNQTEPWDNLFYSDAMSNLYKKQYELEHNMIFDVVVKCRFDLAFNPALNFLNLINFPVINEKTLYADMWLMTPEWYLPNIDDVFFFGTSFTMDVVMSNMPYVANRVYDELYQDLTHAQNPYYKAGPGVNMYRWLNKTNHMVHRIFRPFQIYRKQYIPLDPVLQYHEIAKHPQNVA